MVVIFLEVLEILGGSAQLELGTSVEEGRYLRYAILVLSDFSVFVNCSFQLNSPFYD